MIRSRYTCKTCGAELGTVTGTRIKLGVGVGATFDLKDRSVIAVCPNPKCGKPTTFGPPGGIGFVDAPRPPNGA